MFARRLGIIALVLALEGMAVSLGIPGVPPGSSGGADWLDALHAAQGWLFRFLIAYGSSLAILILSRRAGSHAEPTGNSVSLPVAVPWLIAHGLLLALLVAISLWLGVERAPTVMILSAAARPVLALGAALALAAALAPAGIWRVALRDNRSFLLYAAAMAALAVLAIDLSHVLWTPAAQVTFGLVRVLLSPLYPHLRVDPASLSLATDRFGVIVTDYCSGLEGVGLMLVFCAGWLWCFRGEYRFPRAFLIVPIAVSVIFLLNSVRIAALLMIGDAGHPRIASAGFHSQAGWIGFNATAFVIAMVSKRSRWLTRIDVREIEGSDENPVTPFLLPLAVLLAVGMVTRAFSSEVDLLYSFRVVAALWVLWSYRSVYRRLDWRISARAIGMGTLVFVIWILIARHLTTPQPMPSMLARWPAAERASWIAARVAGAVLTAPIAEELAYRGYLMRRLANRDFETIRFCDVRWPALAISAVVFGMLHGNLWFPGVLAGLAYGWLAIRTGRFGEAVAAHSMTNAWLAAYVLAFDQWQLW
jgi:exosortase E/protease (VPEID-CTERM system)